MKEPRLSKKGKLFVRLCEKIGFTVLTTTLGLVAFFTGHPIIAFAMTVWACWETHGAFKAFFRYSEEPTLIIEKNEAPQNLKEVNSEEVIIEE